VRDRKAEAELVLGGERATGEGLDDGFFFQPTIFTGVKPDRGWTRRRSSGRCCR
jgi:acyl-CoA reductase-like NAD-dependent aldehyde dehydrogenase